MGILLKFVLDCILKMGQPGVHGLSSVDANERLASSSFAAFQEKVGGRLGNQEEGKNWKAPNKPLHCEGGPKSNWPCIRDERANYSEPSCLHCNHEEGKAPEQNPSKPWRSNLLVWLARLTDSRKA